MMDINDNEIVICIIAVGKSGRGLVHTRLVGWGEVRAPTWSSPEYEYF